MDNADTEYWRTTLETAIQTWRRELMSLHFEHRAKERMIIVAQTPHLKAGRFTKKIYDQQGRAIDVNQNVINEFNVRLAQLEVQIEERETLIAQAEDELAGLPPPPEKADG